MLKLFLLSLVCLLVPLTMISFKLKGQFPAAPPHHHTNEIPLWEKKTIMYLGIGSLLFVPVFKTLTHLPPFMGILLGLSILWITTEIIHRRKESGFKHNYLVVGVIQKIDTPSILFFLGILLAVAAYKWRVTLIKWPIF